MAISPIGSATGGIAPLTPLTPKPVDTASDAASGGQFGNALTQALDNVNNLTNKSDKLAMDAATGKLTDIHDYMIASTQAQVATELTVAVRNKAVDAFNEIMRMQV